MAWNDRSRLSWRQSRCPTHGMTASPCWRRWRRVPRLAETRLHGGRNFGFAAKRAGSIVAGAGLMEIEWPPHLRDARRGYVLNAYVEQAPRGRGVARALMAAAGADERARGATTAAADSIIAAGRLRPRPPAVAGWRSAAARPSTRSPARSACRPHTSTDACVEPSRPRLAPHRHAVETPRTTASAIGTCTLAINVVSWPFYHPGPCAPRVGTVLDRPILSGRRGHVDPTPVRRRPRARRPAVPDGCALPA